MCLTSILILEKRVNPAFCHFPGMQEWEGQGSRRFPEAGHWLERELSSLPPYISAKLFLSEGREMNSRGCAWERRIPSQ